MKWKKYSLLTNGTEKTEYQHQYLSPCTEINSKCIKDLNIKSESVKLLEEILGKNLQITGIGKDILTRAYSIGSNPKN